MIRLTNLATFFVKTSDFFVTVLYVRLPKLAKASRANIRRVHGEHDSLKNLLFSSNLIQVSNSYVKKLFLISGLLLAVGAGGTMVASAKDLIPCGKGYSTTSAVVGEKPCNLDSDVAMVVRDAFGFILFLATSFFGLLLGIVFGMTLYAKITGKPNVLVGAKAHIFALGILFCVFFLVYNFLGIMDALNITIPEYVRKWVDFSSAVPSVVPHAYAAEDTFPSVIGEMTWYDFGLVVLRLVMNWMVFPMLAFAWIWSGLRFVFAQGNPQKLTEARSFLIWVTVLTVCIVAVEGLALLFRNTVNEIFS